MTAAQHVREGGPSGAALSALRALAAASLLGAAAIHAAEVVPHGADWAAAGVFFALLALAQTLLAFAAASHPPTRGLALAVVIVNGGALVAWTVSRTVGLPFGPHAGVAEPVGGRDLLAMGLGAAAVAAIAGAAVRSQRVGATPSLVTRIAMALVVLVAGATGAVAGGSDHAQVCEVRPRTPLELLNDAPTMVTPTTNAPPKPVRPSGPRVD